MSVILCLILLVSVFVAKNERMQDTSRVWWFAIAGIFVLIYLLLSIL